MFRSLFGSRPAPMVRKTPTLTPPRAGAVRMFDAAEGGNLYGSWAMHGRSTDAVLRQQLDIVRHRSRDLSRNNPFARRFMALVKSNVIGPSGIQVQARARRARGKLDRAANTLIEDRFAAWSRKGAFDVTGRHSRAAGEALFVQMVARDGEALIRIVEGAPNEFGFALEFIAIDRLDTQLVKELPNGNLIYMGVEYDGWNKPVAYWLLTDDPNGDSFRAAERRYVRYPARDIIHAFVSEDVEQTRGIPWFIAGMRDLKMLGGYVEAELVAARAAASKMGFYRRTDPNAEPPADAVNEKGELVNQATPGHFTILPDGYEFEPYDPQHPNASFEAFVKASLRAVASSTGVAGYNSLANNLEGVNYSSLRQGALEERDGWRCVQAWALESLTWPVAERWLAWMLNTGKLGGYLPSEWERLNAFIFRPRGWRWVDPVKEGQGQAIALAMKVTSRTRICAELGIDFEDVLAELKAERELADEYGVDLEAADAALGKIHAAATLADQAAAAADQADQAAQQEEDQ